MLKGSIAKSSKDGGGGGKPPKKPKQTAGGGTKPPKKKNKKKKPKPQAKSFFNYKSEAFKNESVYNPKTKRWLYITKENGGFNPRAMKVFAEYPDQVEVPNGLVFNKITKKLMKIFNNAGTKLNTNVGEIINQSLLRAISLKSLF